jgi:hypothetical protein
MICAIMQPTYLPWAGYFNLISQADVFVFLDDAQFQKNSWHNRNRVLVNRAPHWISVPVKHNFLGQKINETEIVKTQPWRKKHSKLLQQTYCKHPFSDDILGITNIIEQEDFKNLAELNIRLLLWFIEKLNIKTKTYLSSQIDIDGKRTERIIRILDHLLADTYLSPKGSTEYLEEDGFSDLTETNIVFQNYNSAPYMQCGSNDFESHLSIVDVVANIGWKSTKQYIE